MQSSIYVKQFGGEWEHIEDVTIPIGSDTLVLDVMRTQGVDCYLDVIVYKQSVNVRITSTKDGQIEVTRGFYEKDSEDADVDALVQEIRRNGL
jgi:hypothetical protein